MDNEIQRGERKSSLRGYEEFLSILNQEDDIDFSTFIDPYIEIKQNYEHIAKKRLPKCFSVTYRTVPDALYISFGTKDKCKGEATKFFRDNFHPAFMGTDWKKQHTEARAIRQPQLDKYFKEKKVPIPEVMKLGATFPCSICGKENFTLKDYENKRCFIVEGEGDVNPFTLGHIVCYNCYKKYINP